MFEIQLKFNCILIWCIFNLLNVVFSTIRVLNQTPTRMMSHANGQRAKLLYRMLDTHDDNKEASWGLQIKRYRQRQSSHLLLMTSHFIHLVMRKSLASKTSLWINWQTVPCTKWTISNWREESYFPWFSPVIEIFPQAENKWLIHAFKFY